MKYDLNRTKPGTKRNLELKWTRTALELNWTKEKNWTELWEFVALSLFHPDPVVSLPGGHWTWLSRTRGTYCQRSKVTNYIYLNTFFCCFIMNISEDQLHEVEKWWSCPLSTILGICTLLEYFQCTFTPLYLFGDLLYFSDINYKIMKMHWPL